MPFAHHRSKPNHFPPTVRPHRRANRPAASEPLERRTLLSASITALASFNGLDGSSPDAGIMLSGGTLYGLTGGNYGPPEGPVLFSLPVSGGTPTALASLDGAQDVVLAGNTFYGVEIFAGSSGDGEVFSLPISGGTPTVLASFNGADGKYPTSLIVSGNTIYGTTQGDLDGPTGEIFAVPLAGGTPSVLATFDPAQQGDPLSGLVASGNTLYGLTSGGGTNGDGEAFSLPTAGGTPTVLASFDSTDQPSGNLILSGHTLYGTTSGSAAGDDKIFSLHTSGGTPSIVASLDTLTGPMSLIVSGSTLYGTAEDGGGAGFDGGVFSVPTTGGTPTIMALFNTTDGAQPDGLVLSGNTLYGTAFTGGPSQYAGTVFSLPVTANAASLMVAVDPASQTVNAGDAATFTASAQGNPTPSVQWYAEEPGTGKFTAIPGATSSTYDATDTTGSESGIQYEAIFTNSHGSVTTIPAQLNVLSPATTIASFDGTNGQTPIAIVASGGTLYGATTSGGANGDGEVFSVPVSGGTPTVLASFDSTDPGPDRLILSGNTLYGMTFSSTVASVFSLPVTGGTPTVLASFNESTYGQPGDLLLNGNTLYGAVNNVGSYGYEIFSLPLTGGTPTILVSAHLAAYVSSLAVSAGNVYAVESANGTVGSEIFSIPVTGGATKELAFLEANDAGQTSTSLLVSSNTLFCSTAPSIGEGPQDGGDQEILSLPTSGGTPTALYNFGIDGDPANLILSDGTLYGTDGANYAFSLPASGGALTLLSQLSTTPSDLTLSGNTLYGTIANGGTNSDGEVFAVPVAPAPAAPTVVENPANRKIIAGDNAEFDAVALGYPAPTVQWYVKKAGSHKFDPIEGATSNQYELTNAPFSDDGNLYEAVFTNTTGSATTTAAKLDVVSTPPTITSAPSSASTHARTVSLGVTATDTAPGGAAALKYTWTTLHMPAGAKAPTFNINGTNAAQNITVRFSKDGGYLLQCEVKNASGGTVTTDVPMTVTQTPTFLKLEPHHAHIAKNATQQFTGTVLDQCNHPMRTAQTIAYSVIMGPGSITSTGLFTASSTPGPVTIEQESDDLTSTITAFVE